MPPRNTMIKHTRYLVYLSRTTYNLCSFCSWRKQTESNPSRQPLRTAQRGGETKIRGTGIIPPCNTPLHALSPIHSAVLSLSCPCVRHENVTLTGRNLYIVPQFHRSYATPPHCLIACLPPSKVALTRVHYSMDQSVLARCCNSLQAALGLRWT